MCFQELARPHGVTARTRVRTMTSLRLNPEDLNFPVEEEDKLSSLPAFNTLNPEINCFEFADHIFKCIVFEIIYTSDDDSGDDDIAVQTNRLRNAPQTAVRCNCITMTSQWTRWRLKSPALRLFIQPFIQTQIKENIKDQRYWPLCGEFAGDRWIPRTNGQLRGKCFHLMTSSCGNREPCRGRFVNSNSIGKAMTFCWNPDHSIVNRSQCWHFGHRSCSGSLPHLYNTICSQLWQFRCQHSNISIIWNTTQETLSEMATVGVEHKKHDIVTSLWDQFREINLVGLGHIIQG